MIAELEQEFVTIEKLRPLFHDYGGWIPTNDDISRVLGYMADNDGDWLIEEIDEDTYTDTMPREAIFNALSHCFIGTEWPCYGDGDKVSTRFSFAMEWLATDRGWEIRE